jgi:class 3 adenylate cyclase
MRPSPRYPGTTRASPRAAEPACRRGRAAAAQSPASGEYRALDARGARAADAELAGDGLPPLAFGIGIHRGTVVAGVIGSAALVEYGVIGSPVNVAARVERLTRVHGVDILITDAVRAALDARFEVRPAEVKGVAAPVPTFAVERFHADAGT